MSYENYLPGDTIKAIWINSYATPSPLICRVYNSAKALVDSASMVDSGDGYHFYHSHTVPNTEGFYVVDMLGTIGGKPYRRRIAYRSILGDVL